MANNTGAENPSLVNLLTIVLSGIILIAGALAYINDWFGFDLISEFGDAKTYFLSNAQLKTASPKDGLDVQKFHNIQLLRDATDCLEMNDTNNSAQIVQLHEMIGCYSKTYETMPKIYNDLESYNKKIATSIIVVVVLWISSLWGLRALMISREKQAKASQELSSAVEGVKNAVNEVKADVANLKAKKKKKGD